MAIIGSPLNLTYKSKNRIDIGHIVKITLKNREKEGLILKKVDEPSFKCEEIKEVTPFFIIDSYLKIIKFIATYYVCSIGETIKIFNYFKIFQKLQKENIDIAVELSEKQQKALNFLLNNNHSLLFGDTGSGKTEIYMKLFEKMIREGKSSLFLLPEIALTPQIKKRLKDKFKDRVAIWHSKITKKAKEKLLEAIYRGEIYIIVGTRSALFLPMNNLGLIVVDEEHDDSYKSASKPRINARDLALYFGKALNIRVVLGSATPSLTSYYKIPHFRLKGTFFKNEKEFIFEAGFEEISSNMKKRLLNLGENQAIIFLPTRGNFKYLICGECGEIIECPFCSVAMSLHTQNNYLKCHYCNYTSIIPKKCPKCGSSDFINKRIGTSEVLKEITSLLKDKRVEKFDRDTITTNRKLNSILNDFNDRKIDVLVGTQMISKGHDYHNVKLVIIIGIDALLAQIDYRANEKTLSLLFQIAGRSGRKGSGKVIIQTLNSDFFINFIDDYEEFLKYELEFRKNLYPPFKKLVRFLISHKNPEKAEKSLDEVIKCVEKFKNIEIVGYGEAPIFKIANRYRYHLLIRSDKIKPLLEVSHFCKCAICEIDIDPINFN